jgi:hypothetical protein
MGDDNKDKGGSGIYSEQENKGTYECNVVRVYLGVKLAGTGSDMETKKSEERTLCIRECRESRCMI